MFKKIYTVFKVRKFIRIHSSIKIDLGSGPFHRKGWIGIDLDKNSDIVWDLTRGIPFPNNSVDKIHSEHFFEHLSYPEESGKLFEECYRVLKVGGILRLSVPDIGKILISYSKGENKFWKDRKWWTPHSWIKTPMDVINWYGLMGGEHKFMYDKNTAKARLIEVGFKNVSIDKYNKAQDYNFRESSLYVVGKK